MITVHNIETIVSDPNVRGGQAIIAGTNLRVVDLVSSHIYRGLAPEELAVNFNLNLSQVYAALAFYYQHKAEMDEQIRLDTVKAEQVISELDAQQRLIRIE